MITYIMMRMLPGSIAVMIMLIVGMIMISAEQVGHLYQPVGRDFSYCRKR